MEIVNAQPQEERYTKTEIQLPIPWPALFVMARMPSVLEKFLVWEGCRTTICNGNSSNGEKDIMRPQRSQCLELQANCPRTKSRPSRHTSVLSSERGYTSFKPV